MVESYKGTPTENFSGLFLSACAKQASERESEQFAVHAASVQYSSVDSLYRCCTVLFYGDRITSRWCTPPKSFLTPLYCIRCDSIIVERKLHFVRSVITLIAIQAESYETYNLLRDSACEIER